jgi:PBP1b-binding outer membrane lipoprotein LpoB
MLKRISLLAAIAFFAVACNQSAEKGTSASTETAESSKQESFGAKITEENAVPVDSVVSMLMNSSQDIASVKATGKIDAVCEKKGCWMSLITNSGEKIRVTFKDYGFFVPTSGCDGKTAIVDGKASKKLISVQMLKEYAKDDGKSKVEIDSIKSPSYEYSFEATGVIIK